jgi:hypothetical protein
MRFNRSSGGGLSSGLSFIPADACRRGALLERHTSIYIPSFSLLLLKIG